MTDAPRGGRHWVLSEKKIDGVVDPALSEKVHVGFYVDADGAALVAGSNAILIEGADGLPGAGLVFLRRGAADRHGWDRVSIHVGSTLRHAAPRGVEVSPAP
jgi:hypothetical protein